MLNSSFHNNKLTQMSPFKVNKYVLKYSHNNMPLSKIQTLFQIQSKHAFKYRHAFKYSQNMLLSTVKTCFKYSQNMLLSTDMLLSTVKTCF